MSDHEELGPPAGEHDPDLDVWIEDDPTEDELEPWETHDDVEVDDVDDLDEAPPPASPPAPKRRSHHPIRWVVLTVLLVGVVAVVGGGWWFLRQVDPSGREGAAVVIDVPEGTTQAQLLKMLENKGVIDSAAALGVYLRVRSLGPIGTGEFKFHENQSFGRVVGVVRAGPKVVTYPVTIPEGFTLAQVAARMAKKVPGIEEAAFIAAANAGQVRSVYEPPEVKSLEGFLFPDTYVFGKDVTVDVILQKMVARFDEVATTAGIAKAPNVPPYEVLKIASIIERETRYAPDKPKIARVIYNRLNSGMKLQFDTTVLYGQPPGTKFSTKLNSPYNTYLINGLPPTPICNPGAEAITAAANPAPGSWLFYVLTDKATGAAAFADTFAQHQANVNDAKARGVF